jgi:hypothetical protein
MRRLAGLGVGLTLAFLLLSGSASASSGQITRANANLNWTLGSFAMSLSWTECGASDCYWRPVATVQPTLPSYACTGDEALDSDPNTELVWNGGAETTNTTASFDESDVDILQGVQGQRLCLSVITGARSQQCIQMMIEKGEDPNLCPLIDRTTHRVFASTFLTVDPSLPLQKPGAGGKSGLKLGKVKLDKQAGTATLAVTVPGPGALSVGGKGVVKKRSEVAREAHRLARKVSKAGTYKLKVKAKGAKKRKLLKTGKVKVKAVVTFKPTDGAAIHDSERIRLKKN